MKIWSRLTLLLMAVWLGLSLNACSLPSFDTVTDYGSVYQQRRFHHPDGIGKVYFGREIASVMGHEGAAWLERSQRRVSEQPQQAITALNLKPTDIVADIGAGTGYFTFRMSPLLPQGQVLAVDVQPEMLELIDFVKTQENITNVQTVLADVTHPHLPPETVDLALLVDAYHEFEYPQEMMQGIWQGLKPGGRVVLLEYRKEDPRIMIKGLHKMTEKQVRKELESVGFIWQETNETLPQQHLVIFQKPAENLT
ncbi:MAG: methyltransferase domain-containing protein [Microcoleaceae cyanobacterium]